ncbi:MAG: outer membrane beta-barrel protein [Xanthobacteraceae bacterium]
MRATLFGAAAVSLLTVSVAFGADLAVPAAAPVPPPPFTWTSCYAGGNVGGGFGQKDLNDTAGILSPNTGFTSSNLNISGYMLGGQIGCDYQFASNWILGIEGAASGGDIGGTTTVTTPGIAGDTATFKDTTDFLSSVTARAGLAWDRWMLYGKGGVGFVNDRYNIADAFTTYNFDGVETRLGWTAGVGVEWALWDDWSVKLEYDYYGFGTRNVTFIEESAAFPSGPENIKQTIQTVKLGLNFHVSAWP